MWELMNTYLGSDERDIQKSVVNHVEYTLARTRFDFNNQYACKATSHSVRDRLLEAWNDTQQYQTVSEKVQLGGLSYFSFLIFIYFLKSLIKILERTGFWVTRFCKS